MRLILSTAARLEAVRLTLLPASRVMFCPMRLDSTWVSEELPSFLEEELRPSAPTVDLVWLK